MKIHVFSICLFCLLVATTTLAQQKSFKARFGKISAEEMAMQVYEPDPAVPAVVLFDVGQIEHQFSDQQGFILEFSQHRRIKIFKKDAYHYADVIIPHTKSEKLIELKAVCYNVENGKTQEISLDKSTVVDEKLTRTRMLLKFSIPGVKEGSIIEYKYTFSNPDAIGIRDWVFQQKEAPTLWSEFKAEVPTFIEFKKMSQGWTPFVVAEDEIDQKSTTITASVRSEGNVVSTKTYSDRLEYDVHRMHFVQENVPALHPEPYVASPRAYLSQINFDIRAVYDTRVDRIGAGLKLTNTGFKERNNSWEALGNELVEDVYDNWLKKSDPGSDVAAHAAGASVLEKAGSMYQYIGKNYQLNTATAYPWPTQSIGNMGKDHKGSATELNLLLVGALRSAGLNAWPMLISTQEHGPILQFRVSMDAFDRVIAVVEQTDQSLLMLDAAAFPNPVGLLDKQDLNGSGLILKPDMGSVWMPVLNKIASRTAVLATVDLKTGGALHGSVTISESGYGAIESLKNISSMGREKALSTHFSSWTAFGNLHSFSAADPDAEAGGTHKSTFEIDSEGLINDARNKCYFSPTLGLGQMENPFKNPDRKFNISFGSPSETIYVFTFNVPAGYAVEEVPKSMKMSFGDNALVFDYIVESTPGTIKVTVRDRIKNPDISVEEYADLQQFFGSKAAKMAEQIVLVKQ